MNDKTKQVATNIGSRAVQWLKGRGWGETLAKVTVAGALGAALGIAAALGLTACNGHYLRAADGAVDYTYSIGVSHTSNNK